MKNIGRKRKRRGAVTAAVCLSVLAGAAVLPVSAVQEVRQGTESGEKPLLSPAIAILASRTAMVKSGVCGEAICFASGDFADVLGYTPTAVTLKTLPDPAAGSLRLGTLDLQAGQSLSAQTVEQLRFVPRDPGAPASASFTFTAEGKAYETSPELTCSVYILTEENEAPTAEDTVLSAFAGIPVYSAVRASDPEQDALTYTVVRAPKKGTVSLDPQTGTFTYLPDTGKKGTDVFTCRVSDRYGNTSGVCKVMLNVKKPDASVTYADLEGHWAACAAQRMAEEGILVGEQVGDTMFFYPERSVSRGEFLVMAMRAAGQKPSDRDLTAEFADLADIPVYMRPYVKQAYDMGIAAGCETENGRMFLPDAAVTRAEAAVIVDRLLGLEPPEAVPVFADADALPAWSVSAVQALHAAGILLGQTDENGTRLDPMGILDRAQAAQLLMMTMDCGS